jgi:hypothetical protein
MHAGTVTMEYFGVPAWGGMNREKTSHLNMRTRVIN